MKQQSMKQQSMKQQSMKQQSMKQQSTAKNNLTISHVFLISVLPIYNHLMFNAQKHWYEAFTEFENPSPSHN